MVKNGFILLLFLSGWLSDCVLTQQRTPREYQVQPARFTLEKRPTQEIMWDNVMPDIAMFLSSVSPPHTMCLLYDDTFEDVDFPLFIFANKWTATNVVKFSSNLTPLFDALSSSLSSASSVRRQVFLLCSLDNIITVFRKVSSENEESHSIWWLVIATDNKTVKMLQEVLRDGFQVTIFLLMNQGSVLIYTSSIDRCGKFRFRDIGVWKKDFDGHKKNFLMNVFPKLDEVYSDLNGRPLTITAIDDPPFIILEEISSGEYLASGFENSIIEAMSEALNFTYTVTTPADQLWGGRLPNGSVVGMIGSVYKRDAHCAISEITITREREQVIDFTYPYYVEGLTLVSRAPREKNRAFAVFTPFTAYVWITIIAATVIMGPILSFLSFLLESYLPDSNIVSYNMREFLFNVYRSLMKQENLLPAIHWSFSFTFVSWYFFCLVISVVYSGVLIATLVKPSYEKPINSLTDLPEAVGNGFTLVVNADTSKEYMFKEAKEGIYADTWKLFNHKDRSKSFPLNSDDVYGGILTDKLIIVKGEVGGRFRNMKRGEHRFHVARDTFSPQLYGMACFQGAPFQANFNKMLNYMVEGGLIAKWLNNEFRKVSGNNIITEESGPKAFTLTQLQASFYILLIGYIGAAMTFGLEEVVSFF